MLKKGSGEVTPRRTEPDKTLENPDMEEDPQLPVEDRVDGGCEGNLLDGPVPESTHQKEPKAYSLWSRQRQDRDELVEMGDVTLLNNTTHAHYHTQL
jgi:hypothetical protein